jgi:hypothetical protein
MTVHVATSAEIGRIVARALRSPVSFVPDNLLVGPCAEGFDAHRRLRIDTWEHDARQRARFSRAFDGLATAIDSRARMVVWTSPLWSDRVAFWGLCAFRLCRWPSRPRLLAGRLGPDTASAFGCGSVRVPPAEVRRAAEELSPLSKTYVRRCSASWRKLAGRRPVLAGPVREELADVGTYQAGFFPRLRAATVHLSRFDELLFSCVGEGWSTPVDVFLRRSAAGEELRRWISHAGDVFLSVRLRQWAQHGVPAAALESEPGRNIMTARYRLSHAGREIGARGLREIAQGAPLSLWGSVAYSPLAPWVAVEDEPGRLVLRLASGSAQRRGELLPR